MPSKVGLFDNEREANVRSCIQMVESALTELGHDPEDSRTETESGQPGWHVRKGSAKVDIALVDRSDFIHLQVIAPVLRTDDKVDLVALYSRLLTLNSGDVYGAAFAVRGSQVLLVAERSTIDLDRSEVLDLIGRVRDYADHYDNVLVDEFGGTLA